MASQSTDRLELVRLFLRVAETSQVSEAARTLGLSQPTASRSLKRLETMLGVQLIDRSPQGLCLTQAGRNFIVPARNLIDAWHEVVDAAQADKATISGTIRIAVPVAVGQEFLAKIAARFLKLHPGLAIEWHLRDDAVDVTAGGYDVWVRVGEIHREDLVVQHVYRVERAIVSAPGGSSGAHPSELEGRPAVRYSTFVSGTVELAHGDATCRLRQRAVFVTDNLYAARSAVEEGVGYAVLPLWSVQTRIAGGALMRLCEPWRAADVTVSLAYAPSRSKSPRVAAFLAYMRSELQDDRGAGVAFLREMGAMESVTRLGHSRR